MSASSLARRIASTPAAVKLRRVRFRTARYWDDRYAKGGTSGAGSYGAAAEWKASTVNGWVGELGVESVVDLGCGDGNQLGLADYPRYLGLDLSEQAIHRCIERFADDPTKSFIQYEPGALADPAGWLRADLALSMEVIFHLVDDGMFEDYMTRLFDAAHRYVVICSTDAALDHDAPHERHRPFTPWVERNRPDWTLDRRIDPPPELALASSLYLIRRADRAKAATTA